jgi:predicted transcriptional regulator
MDAAEAGIILKGIAATQAEQARLLGCSQRTVSRYHRDGCKDLPERLLRLIDARPEVLRDLEKLAD